MKLKNLAIITAITLSLSACGGRCSNNQHAHDHENCTEHNHNHNTHTHADGTVHSDHAPEQESFKVEADSTTVNADTVKHNHTHDCGHDHAGHNHKH